MPLLNWGTLQRLSMQSLSFTGYLGLSTWNPLAPTEMQLLLSKILIFKANSNYRKAPNYQTDSSYMTLESLFL